MKPRVLLIPDTSDWAFDIRANYLIKYLSEYYDFTKMIFSQIYRKGPKSVNWDYFDCIFLFYWKHFRIWKFHPPKEKISTGIFSFCSIEDTESYISSEINKFKALIISTPLLGRFYSLHPNVFYAPNAVDETIFFPKNISTKEFTIGWAGDPEYCGGKDRKGVYGILSPVAKALSINLELALDIPHSDMVDFYNKLDVCVCVSQDDGGPNHILEAQACGIPVISTRVGIAEELIKDGHNGLLIDRSKVDLTSALEKLRDEPELRQAMGRNARQEILKNWTYKQLCLNYKRVFDFVIEGKKERVIKRIAIITPKYEDYDKETKESLKKAKKELEGKFEFIILSASGPKVHVNRTHLFNRALQIHKFEKSLDFILILDSDISFEPSDITTLVEFIESGKGHCVTGEFFSRHTYLTTMAWGGSPEEGVDFSVRWDLNKYYKIYGCGLGFFMMSAYAALKYEKVYTLPEWFCPSWQRCPTINEWQYVGDDIDFCVKMEKIGFDVWLDTHVQLSHKGINRFNFKDKSIPRNDPMPIEEKI